MRREDRNSKRNRQKNRKGHRKRKSNDSIEIPDSREASEEVTSGTDKKETKLLNRTGWREVGWLCFLS